MSDLRRPHTGCLPGLAVGGSRISALRPPETSVFELPGAAPGSCASAAPGPDFALLAYKLQPRSLTLVCCNEVAPGFWGQGPKGPGPWAGDPFFTLSFSGPSLVFASLLSSMLPFSRNASLSLFACSSAWVLLLTICSLLSKKWSETMVDTDPPADVSAHQDCKDSYIIKIAKTVESSR